MDFQIHQNTPTNNLHLGFMYRIILIKVMIVLLDFDFGFAVDFGFFKNLIGGFRFWFLVSRFCL